MICIGRQEILQGGADDAVDGPAEGSEGVQCGLGECGREDREGDGELMGCEERGEVDEG